MYTFFFFSAITLTPSTDYSIVVMFITCMCIGNPKIHMTRFIIILALLRSSRTELYCGHLVFEVCLDKMRENYEDGCVDDRAWGTLPSSIHLCSLTLSL